MLTYQIGTAVAPTVRHCIATRRPKPHAVRVEGKSTARLVVMVWAIAASLRMASPGAKDRTPSKISGDLHARGQARAGLAQHRSVRGTANRAMMAPCKEGSLLPSARSVFCCDPVLLAGSVIRTALVSEPD